MILGVIDCNTVLGVIVPQYNDQLFGDNFITTSSYALLFIIHLSYLHICPMQG